MRNDVIIVRDYPSDNVDVYVFMGDHIGRYEMGVMEWLPYQDGTKPEYPTLRIRADIWEMIMREALGPAPSEEVLKDARTVRDRLLVMIESAWSRNDQ